MSRIFDAFSDLVSIGCEVGVAKLEDFDNHDQSNDVPGGTHHDWGKPSPTKMDELLEKFQKILIDYAF